MRSASGWRVSRNDGRKRCSADSTGTHDLFGPGKLIRRCLHEYAYGLPAEQDHHARLACAYRGTMKLATSVKESFEHGDTWAAGG